MTTAYPTDTRPAPAAAMTMAAAAIKQYPMCFWFRAKDAPLNDVGDVELVVRRLRQYGNRASWEKAYEIEQCL